MGTDYFVMKTCVENWLSYIHDADNRIAYLEAKIPEINSRIIGLGYDPSSQGGEASSGKIPDGIATLEELKNEWSAEVSEKQREIEYVKQLCQSANVEQHIVWMRCVEHKPWALIADAVGYSKKQAQRKYEDGIAKLYPFVPNQISHTSFPNAEVL